ncbi:Uncharacterised protein [Mycobacteroides abscessus subsp. abscessus]|nr:Uncharacterised protein [Mycobacteroides abscessus subsp. abscessus]
MQLLLLGLPVQARPLTAVALGGLQDCPALLLGIDGPFHACHKFVPSSDAEWCCGVGVVVVGC